jgi:hypothetical protein
VYLYNLFLQNHFLGVKGIYIYLSLKALSGTRTRDLSNSRPVCFSYKIIFCAYFWIRFLISRVIVAWNMVWERWVESILYQINLFHFLKFVLALHFYLLTWRKKTIEVNLGFAFLEIIKMSKNNLRKTINDKVNICLAFWNQCWKNAIDTILNWKFIERKR